MKLLRYMTVEQKPLSLRRNGWRCGTNASAVPPNAVANRSDTRRQKLTQDDQAGSRAAAGAAKVKASAKNSSGGRPCAVNSLRAASIMAGAPQA